MSRNLHTRLTLAFGALLTGLALVPSVQAGDEPAQRVAMACNGDVAGCKAAARHTARGERAAHEVAPGKAPARRPHDGRTVTASVSDGSRFLYDSCGCSND